MVGNGSASSGSKGCSTSLSRRDRSPRSIPPWEAAEAGLESSISSLDTLSWSHWGIRLAWPVSGWFVTPKWTRMDRRTKTIPNQSASESCTLCEEREGYIPTVGTRQITTLPVAGCLIEPSTMMTSSSMVYNMTVSINMRAT